MVSGCAAIVILRLWVRAWTRLWSFWLSEVMLVLGVISFTVLAIGDTSNFARGFDYANTYDYDEALAKVRGGSLVMTWHLHVHLH
jgi:hypothetical protein